MSNRLETTAELPERNCKREHVYELLRTAMMGTGSVDGTYLTIVDGHIEPSLSIPRWKKFTVTHTQFQAAALVKNVTLFTIPAGGIVHAVKIKHSAAFAGTGISAYSVSVGITGNETKYAGAFAVGGVAVADTTFQTSSTLAGETHAVAGTAIVAKATAVGANLDQSSGGSVDIWVLYSAVT